MSPVSGPPVGLQFALGGDVAVTRSQLVLRQSRYTSASSSSPKWEVWVLAVVPVVTLGAWAGALWLSRWKAGRVAQNSRLVQKRYRGQGRKGAHVTAELSPPDPRDYVVPKTMNMRDIESLPTLTLVRLLGNTGNTKGLERHELVALVASRLKAQALIRQVLESNELGGFLLEYLDVNTLLRLGRVTKSTRRLVDSAPFWRPHVIKVMRDKYISRLDKEASEKVITAVKQAHDNGFFHNIRGEAADGALESTQQQYLGWKRFLANYRRLEKVLIGGFGNAVIVSREDLSPHHILQFVQLLSIRKHSSCTIRILQRFLSLYKSLGAEENGLRGNVGYLFQIYKDGVKDGQESVSHHDFMEVTRSSNLQIVDLLEFFDHQTIVA